LRPWSFIGGSAAESSFGSGADGESSLPAFTLSPAPAGAILHETSIHPPSLQIMTRSILSTLCAALLLGASVSAPAATKVTEADYRVYRELNYAEALFSARQMFLRADPAKVAAAKAELTKAWTASGWTRDQHSEVEMAISEVLSTLSMVKSGEMTEADFREMAADWEATTIATVRAHYDELQNTGDTERAEKQVREEIARERSGDPVTPEQLLGTWVFDVDATLAVMGLGQLNAPEREKLKADMLAQVGSPSYTFGPGNTVESRAKGADGQEAVSKGVYRLDGMTMFIKAEGLKREEDIQVGLRDGTLRMGRSFGLSVFVRK
jgi:hypothetical protein